MRPTRACTRARAASAASIASNQARSDTASRISSGTKISSNGKEHRLVLALQVDVEAEHAVLLAREETGERRVGRLGQGDTRSEPLEEPAREHGHREVRALRPLDRDRVPTVVP